MDEKKIQLFFCLWVYKDVEEKTCGYVRDLGDLLVLSHMIFINIFNFKATLIFK